MALICKDSYKAIDCNKYKTDEMEYHLVLVFKKKMNFSDSKLEEVEAMILKFK